MSLYARCTFCRRWLPAGVPDEDADGRRSYFLDRVNCAGCGAEFRLGQLALRPPSVSPDELRAVAAAGPAPRSPFDLIPEPPRHCWFCRAEVPFAPAEPREFGVVRQADGVCAQCGAQYQRSVRLVQPPADSAARM